MRIAVRPLKLRAEPGEPEYIDSSLHDFLVINAHDYQECPTKYPFDQEGREGGCQYAFDRDEQAVIRCIDCASNPCTCDCSQPNRPRYALQDFSETLIYMLDLDLAIDLSAKRTYWPRKDWCRYHALLWEEESKLREMELRLMDLCGILFFHRTKNNGFRVAFESDAPISSSTAYEAKCRSRELEISRCTPDRKLGSGAWFKVDGISYHGLAYFSYPRVRNPVWLNPLRHIR